MRKIMSSTLHALSAPRAEWQVRDLVLPFLLHIRCVRGPAHPGRLGLLQLLLATLDLDGLWLRLTRGVVNWTMLALLYLLLLLKCS